MGHGGVHRRFGRIVVGKRHAVEALAVVLHFGILGKQSLSPTSFPTKRALRDHMAAFMRSWNRNPTPFEWTKSARAVLNHCRGLSPFPGAWFEIPGAAGSARVKVLRCALAHSQGSPGEVLDDHLTIACGDGALRILQLQRAGKLAMQADEFLRGTPLSVGARVT